MLVIYVLGHVRRRGQWEEWLTAFETDQEHDVPGRLSRLVYDLASGFDQRDPIKGQLLGVYVDVWNGSIPEQHEAFLAARIKARACNGSWVKALNAEMKSLMRQQSSTVGPHDPRLN